MSHDPRDDPRRDPLDLPSVRRDLLAPAGPLARLDVVEASGSTNADLADAVRRAPGEWPAPAALVAEHQTAGRGRAGRGWQTPPRAALTVSVLLRPRLEPARLGWLPLLAGLAVARAVDAAGVPGAAVKWPNDVLLPAADDAAGLGPFRKVAGVLAEVVPAIDGQGPAAVVVGVGLNVDQSAAELPVPTATSLALEGARADRGALLGTLVRELVGVVADLEAARGDADAAGLAARYAAASATLGTAVRAELAGGRDVVEGEAVRVAADGALVLATAGGERTVTAGDVHHLRTA
ncbi:biotin--[acetyl-CoA-carboxylase] ligase [Isoptericola sp. NPDC019571]|uniref:biotin--[acetyl-CoA-carboxylase] ligase n=1 Tax=Isoptericola sp. NPDC019571 TaxID=3364008 RepID=UPI003799175B